MNKQYIVRLDESQFNSLVTKIVKESVKKVLNETDNYSQQLQAFKAQKQQHIEKLKSMIPYLRHYSPEERQEIETEMMKYGINPRG